MAGLGNVDFPMDVLYVHQALLDEQCHPLCDELREYWKVFDFETVRRFALCLYNADYDYPMPVPVETTTPPSDVSNKPEPQPESGTPGLPSPLGANSVNSTTPAVGSPGVGGSSDSSTSFDATSTSPAPENTLETVEKPTQVLRYGLFSGRTGGFGSSGSSKLWCLLK